MTKPTSNPWLDIPAKDYEDHMLEVGQAQAFNQLMKDSLETYNPKSFALIGCSTGNGLEHVYTEITKKVFALDINEKYLLETRHKYASIIPGLKTIHCDIGREKLPFSGIDLMFTGLVLEYTNPEAALTKMLNALEQNGIIHIVIQRNKKTSFVTKTKYTSLEKLSQISLVVNRKDVDDFMANQLMLKLSEYEILLTEQKSFISLKYQKP